MRMSLRSFVRTSDVEMTSYDAIVIGGGPAGATAAAVLAEKGRRVAVLEKERFPRYHIGESLMPYCYYTFERLGVLEKLQASHFPKKYSVQFVSTAGLVSAPFYFYQHLKHEAAVTWQVLRSEFDHMLLDNAAEKGAQVYQGTLAREAIREHGAVCGVQATDANGDEQVFRAPVTIDASGRDAFWIGRSGWRVRDPNLSKISLWTYYRGALRDPGLDEGATTVAYLPEKGWVWYIALPDDVVSVGVVAERDYLYRDGKDPEAIFEREVQINPWIRNHVAPGKPIGQVWVTGDYSYRARYCATNGLVLVGDAFAFLDPVFSSGVFLALRSGELAADAVDAALRAGNTSAAQFEQYGKTLCSGIEAMRKLVYAFYDHAFSFRSLVQASPEIRGDLTDCLIGDLFRDLSPLFEAVAHFAALPEPLDYGKPLTRQAMVATE